MEWNVNSFVPILVWGWLIPDPNYGCWLFGSQALWNSLCQVRQWCLGTQTRWWWWCWIATCCFNDPMGTQLPSNIKQCGFIILWCPLEAMEEHSYLTTLSEIVGLLTIECCAELPWWNYSPRSAAVRQDDKDKMIDYCHLPAPFSVRTGSEHGYFLVAIQTAAEVCRPWEGHLPASMFGTLHFGWGRYLGRWHFPQCH